MDDDALFEAAAFDDDQGDAEPEPTRCLFSEQVFANPAECLAHAKAAFGLDLAAIAGTLALDFDGRLRLVNFVRSAAAKPGADPAAVPAGPLVGGSASCCCSHVSNRERHCSASRKKRHDRGARNTAGEKHWLTARTAAAAAATFRPSG